VYALLFPFVSGSWQRDTEGMSKVPIGKYFSDAYKMMGAGHADMDCM